VMRCSDVEMQSTEIHFKTLDGRQRAPSSSATCGGRYGGAVETFMSGG
jgi:hypothetical protein